VIQTIISQFLTKADRVMVVVILSISSMTVTDYRQ
jgi:hypothetical protein